MIEKIGENLYKSLVEVKGLTYDEIFKDERIFKLLVTNSLKGELLYSDSLPPATVSRFVTIDPYQAVISVINISRTDKENVLEIVFRLIGEDKYNEYLSSILTFPTNYKLHARVLRLANPKLITFDLIYNNPYEDKNKLKYKLEYDYYNINDNSSVYFDQMIQFALTRKQRTKNIMNKEREDKIKKIKNAIRSIEYRRLHCIDPIDLDIAIQSLQKELKDLTNSLK